MGETYPSHFVRVWCLSINVCYRCLIRKPQYLLSASTESSSVVEVLYRNLIRFETQTILK